MLSRESSAKQTAFLSLVDDEVVHLGKWDFRFQVWRGRDVSTPGPQELQPVVLMLQLPGMPPPDYYTTMLATIALRYVSAPPIPLFFQYSLRDGKPRAFRVTFQVGGSRLRPWLHDARYGKVDAAMLERIFCITMPKPLGKANARAVRELSRCQATMERTDELEADELADE